MRATGGDGGNEKNGESKQEREEKRIGWYTSVNT